MSRSFDISKNYYSYINKKTTPLVFIHGVGLDHTMWKPQISYFKKFSIIVYDILGHGKTSMDIDKLSLNDFSQQLFEILNNLKLKKINLIGFSLGSLIALDFASKYEDKLNKLILIGTTYKRSSEETEKVVDRLNQAKLNKPLSKQALKRWFSDKFLEKNPGIYKKFIKILSKDNLNHKNFIKAYDLFANYQDNVSAINKISTDTLLMTGSEDSGSTPEMSKNLSNDLQNSSFVEIKGGKHLCSIEYSEDVNMNIEKFINK